jgi:hypothetical protein
LATQREAMDEIERLREALALSKEKKDALEVELSKAQNKQLKPKYLQQNIVKKQSDNTA